MWPSAFDFVMISTAMFPAAPGRLSTTMRWPVCAAILSLTMRATTSVGPPAGNPTSSRIGRLGQSCAWQTALAAASSAAMPNVDSPLTCACINAIAI